MAVWEDQNGGDRAPACQRGAFCSAVSSHDSSAGRSAKVSQEPARVAAAEIRTPRKEFGGMLSTCGKYSVRGERWRNQGGRNAKHSS
eukprot:4170358-Pyramimonas_sp.AAC.1